MTKQTTDLSTFSNPEYSHGKSVFIRLAWMLTSRLFFQTQIPYPSKLKVFLLQLFGAKTGKKIVIKPSVTIKQPWRLEIGDHSWIGEMVWIDNLVQVKIGPHCCLSQGAFLLTGNHNYKKTSFDLMTGAITLEDGVWIGAKSIVGPNVICHSHAVLAAGSSAFKNLDAYSIYQGNPAQFLRNREL
jgi:putative colanic acid biosynthesis acetyltransferase WcaF